MSATVPSPLPPAPAVEAPPPAATAVSPVRVVRAFGVMLGGPLVLLTAVVGSAAHTARALRLRRAPRPAAVGVLGVAAAYHRWAIPWMRRWGATDAEVAMTLPGDATIARPGLRQTRAVPIAAPTHAVWPWVAQIGQDRAGFYSYTWLENLAGCLMPNADSIHPEWGRRAVGETVLLHPDSGLKVLGFDPGRGLVLEGGWSFALKADGPDSCRLIARFIAPRGAAGTAYGLLLELPHFVMERKMLLTIKDRAQTTRSASSPWNG